MIERTTDSQAAALPPLGAQLAGVVARYEGTPAPPKRKGGRPRKRTPEYLRAVIEKHCEVERWFMEEFGTAPRSDRELYTQYFGHMFVTRGQRESRAHEPRLQGPLKTALNELAEARRLVRALPENRSINGSGSPLECRND